MHKVRFVNHKFILFSHWHLNWIVTRPKCNIQSGIKDLIGHRTFVSHLFLSDPRIFIILSTSLSIWRQITCQSCVNLSLIKLKSLSPSPWIISRRNFLHSDQLITHLFDCFNLELVITFLTNSCYWCFDEFTVFEPPSLVSVMNECYTIFIHDTDSVNRLNFRSIFILCYVFFLFLLIQYDQYNFVDAHSPKIISIYFPPRNKKMQSNKKTNSFFIDVIGSNLDNLLRAVRSQMKVLFGADFL